MYSEKIKMKRSAFLPLVFGLLAMGACKNDGCNEPFAFNYDPEGTTAESCVYAPVDLVVKFEPMFGEEHIMLEGDQSFRTSDGRHLLLEHFGIYLTGIEVKVNDEYRPLDNNMDCLERAGDAFLLKNDQRVFSAPILPDEGFDITAIKFNIGVDECRNDSLDPTTQLEGPFMPQVPTMYWSWATGYRFISIDGRVDASANADSSLIAKFEYHTGLNNLLRTVELETSDLSLSDQEIALTIKVDLQKLFENIDFTTELVTHTSNNLPLALKVTENATKAFSIQDADHDH